MTETRIEVHQSDVKTMYIPQYKAKLLGFGFWESFDTHCVGTTYKAYMKGVSSGEVYGTKEFAELVCEQYHLIANRKQDKKIKEKLHKQTNKVSHYKHP